jgi:hypothetical protein
MANDVPEWRASAWWCCEPPTQKITKQIAEHAATFLYLATASNRCWGFIARQVAFVLNGSDAAMYALSNWTPQQPRCIGASVGLHASWDPWQEHVISLWHEHETLNWQTPNLISCAGDIATINQVTEKPEARHRHLLISAKRGSSYLIGFDVFGIF